MLEFERTNSTKNSVGNDTMRVRITENGPTRRAFVATAAISTVAMLLARSSSAALLKSNDDFLDKLHNIQNLERLLNRFAGTRLVTTANRITSGSEPPLLKLARSPQRWCRTSPPKPPTSIRPSPVTGSVTFFRHFPVPSSLLHSKSIA